MTCAVVEIDGGSCLLTARGHATGCTEVCAAVSAIIYALSGYVLNAGEHLRGLERNELRSAWARIECSGDACLRAAFRMAGIGLAQVAKAYPEQLTVRFTEEGGE